MPLPVLTHSNELSLSHIVECCSRHFSTLRNLLVALYWDFLFSLLITPTASEAINQFYFCAQLRLQLFNFGITEVEHDPS